MVSRAVAVMPGMWDCHGHFLGSRSFDLGKLPHEPLALRGARSARDLRAALDAGVTSVREVGGMGVELARAVASAVSHNIVVVAAAGNEGLSLPTYPAALPGVLGVGASDRDDERDSDFSETGASVDVAAPGVDIVSTVPGGGQCVDSGTSFSAPYAAAVAALLKQVHPHWTAAQIIARIEQTAQRTVRPPRAPSAATLPWTQDRHTRPVGDRVVCRALDRALSDWR